MKLKKCVQDFTHKLLQMVAWTNPILQTTVIDGAGFGQPGTIQAAFGQNELYSRYLLIKPCTTKLYL
jgi:hypothetical protein